MILDSQNKHFKLAFDFVNDTQCPLYLTGKAGTGKTTFLKYVKQHCSKRMIVVAPTGVAAINAGGVTMHSFFQLPFGPYIPSIPKGFGMNDNVANRTTLLKNLRLTNIKRKIIEELELLIIDEVSMLRSDMLDAIDTILRSVRRNQKPFGGVQVLLIGDLYQLPPVVTHTEKELLDEHYKSPFFFHAKVLEETQPIFIELKKIYRQNEQSFIDLLNNLRNNNLTHDDYERLNERYNPSFYDNTNKYITLTSHNYKADTINKEELDRLKTPLHEFKGEIKNDFGEKQLPTDMTLCLKEGAQVMFIKNDSSIEKRYYNGKIVTIYKINDDEITVQFPDTKETLIVERETWDNISYTINPETNEIEEKVLGQFIQIPLRLAWAITIHKSQGLTFEHAIIDAGQSFAAGQVYVALSRCTSLQGLVLHSQITPRSLHSDYRIYDFNMNEQSESTLERTLTEERYHYQTERLIHLFNWKKMLDAVYLFHQATLQCKSLPNADEANLFCKDLIEKTKSQKEVADKFLVQLQSLFNDLAFSQNSNALVQRTRKAIEFFTRSIHNDLILPFDAYITAIKGAKRIKKYTEELQQFESSLWGKIDELQKSTFDSTLLADGIQHYTKDAKPFPNLSVKKTKGDSAKETFAYFMAGKSITEIATQRNLALSTIEGHLAEFVKKGEIDIFQLLTLEQLELIHQTHIDTKPATTKELRESLNNQFSYAMISLALDYFAKETV
jgi:uncharacterized protein YpbB